MIEQLVWIATAGGIGGVLNALLTDNGFLLPRKESVGKNTFVRPGFLGNILVSSVSAAASWSLYGPAAGSPFSGGSPESEIVPALTLSALAAALLVGIGGARWLTSEIDKKVLRNIIAGDLPNGERRRRVLRASPFQVAASVSNAASPAPDPSRNNVDASRVGSRD